LQQFLKGMLKRCVISILFFLLASPCSLAQDKEIKPFLAKQIAVLADSAMLGRGYVKKGREKAAWYLKKQFKKYHLKPAGKGKSYAQRYYFPVNTFPGNMELMFDGVVMVPGKDFIVDAASQALHEDSLPVVHIKLDTVSSIDEWNQILATLQPDKAYYLQNVDTVCRVLGIRRAFFPSVLPKGCFIIPQKEKFIWTVARNTIHATVFYIDEQKTTHIPAFIAANIDQKLVPKSGSENIIGVLPGRVKDTFIAITAHYDHLGMMGKGVIFPGASDNASGSAMLLYLARYFSTHSHNYSILFIAFSGEEAGLLGSEYYVNHHSGLALSQIKFLTNVDIMGDATDGATVVNATEYPVQFDLLQQINTDSNYLPQIKSRGKAANSDHYHFTEAGVPSFFLYTNGGKGYYHDIYDKPAELSLNNMDNVARLLIDFINAIK
jgi:hypothetical protein